VAEVDLQNAKAWTLLHEEAAVDSALEDLAYKD